MTKKVKEKKIKSENKFRLSCKHLFLTYSRCPLELQEAMDQLNVILFNYKIKSFLIVREEHSEDEIENTSKDNESKIKEHLHIYVQTEKKVNITNPDRLHLMKNDVIYKGNYQASKNPAATLDYLLKSFSTKDHPWILASSDLKERLTNEATISAFDTHLIELARQNRIEEAMQLYEKERPGDFLKNHLSIEKSLKGIYLKHLGAITKLPYEDFNCPETLTSLLKSAEEDKRTLLLVGGPGTGKTKFILFHLHTLRKLNPLIVNNIDSLRDFKNNIHHAILYDDCCFKNVSREELIKLMDSEDETTHNVKHLSVRIPSNTPRFVISNKNYEELFAPHHKDEAIRRRIYVYTLENGTKLFGETPVLKQLNIQIEEQGVEQNVPGELLNK